MMIKTVPAGFTVQDLRAFLRGQEEIRLPEGYRTTREWARVFNVKPLTMHEIMREAYEAGKLLRQGGLVERIDGRLTRVMFYAFADDHNDHNVQDEAGAEGGDALREGD